MAKSEQFEHTVYANSRDEGRELFVTMACAYFGVGESDLWVRIFKSRPNPRRGEYSSSKEYALDCGAMLKEEPRTVTYPSRKL